jgi:hypothetical protein
VRRLLVIVLAVCAGFAAAPHRAAADTCGVPEKGTIWVDFADGSVPFWQTFARPGVIAAAANFIYPPQLRAYGARTVYFDLNFRLRVGTPLEPYDPSLVIDRANRLYATAAMSSGCTQPTIAENELNGANLVTPWTANNAAYRRNVLIYVQTLSALGARPVILVPSAPYMGDVAGDWWRELAKYSDIVRETYFGAPSIVKQGPIEGSRSLRTMFRKRVAEFTSAGIPTSRLGLMLGFQTTRGSGGREGASRKSWLELTKLQALAAKEVASEVKLRSIWSWGWAAWSPGEQNPDKPAAACVYLWARSQGLCNGPGVAGKGFDASLTEGQLTFPTGTRCTLYGHAVTESAISALRPVTGDPDVAFSTAFAQVVTSLAAPLKPKQISDAERAVVAANFGGSYARYRAALAKAHAGIGAARAVIAEELRRVAIESRFHVGGPSAEDIREFYATYGQSLVRPVESKTKAPWLGNRTKGFALADNAPPQLFTLRQGGKWKTIRTMRGSFQVKALDDAMPLGALPLDVARRPIVNALQELSRADSYESWLLAREKLMAEQAVCRRDAQPEPAAVDLTEYLPFLAAD